MSLPSVGPRALAAFYEAAIDEVECGWSPRPGCTRDATTGIEWADGTQSVACDVHAAIARYDWPQLIARMSTWVPDTTGGCVERVDTSG